MKISIREVKESDSAEIARLSSQLGYPTTENKVLENIVELLQDPENVVFVEEDDKENLLGFVHVFVKKRLFLDDRAELGGLIVDQDFRGKGIGKSLLMESERWAASMKCKKLCVRSNMIRTETKEFYLSQGYFEKKQQWVFLKDLL